MGCAGPLAGDDTAGNSCNDTVFPGAQLFGRTDAHALQLFPAMGHGMSSDGDTSAGVIGNHALFRIHGMQR